MQDHLETYRNAWKRQNNTFESDQIEEEHIMEFIHSESNSITARYRKSIVFDMCLKSALALSFLILAFLLHSNPALIALNAGLMIASVGMLAAQAIYYRRVQGSEQQDQPIQESLQRKINMLAGNLSKAVYLAALTAPLVVLSGGMTYFYVKYGTVRPLDGQDYLVFGTFLLASFVIAAVAQRRELRFHIQQLETCLNDVDDEAIRSYQLKKQQNQRLFTFLFFTGLFILVLLAVLYVIKA